MNKIFLKKILLSVLIVSIVSFGLTGCTLSSFDSSETCDTSTVTIHLTSTYPDHHYNIYMDEYLYHSNVTVGNYSINNVPTSNDHVFKVVHHKGLGFGSVSKTVYITECEEGVYINATF